MVVGHGLIAAAAAVLRAEIGLTVVPWAFHWEELIVLGGLLVLGALVGTVPAAKAYRTDVAEGLGPS
jgi:putative ABC transport system permease protein